MENLQENEGSLLHGEELTLRLFRKFTLQLSITYVI